VPNACRGAAPACRICHTARYRPITQTAQRGDAIVVIAAREEASSIRALRQSSTHEANAMSMLYGIQFIREACAPEICAPPSTGRESV